MTDHAGRTHALFSASSSDRWMNCVGSIQRAATMPPGVQSGYAEDGQEAHELLEYCLLNRVTDAMTGLHHSGIVWTHRFDDYPKRIDSVQDAIDYIDEFISAYAPNCQVFLECQFVFPTTGNDDCGGTSDVAIVVPDLDMCIVIDFKHGAGYAVTATENSQLMFYAVGVRQELRKQGLLTSGRVCYRLAIAQPRAFHREGKNREWITDDARLDLFVAEVDVAIAKSKEQSPAIVPGKWCRWCPAYSMCPDAERDRMSKIPLPQYNTFQDVKTQALPPMEGLDVAKLAEIMQAEKAVMEWFDTARNTAYQLARQGVQIPGFKLVEAQARRRWHGSMVETATALAHIISNPDRDAFMPRTIVGITEAERLVKEAVYRQVTDKGLRKKLMQDANEAMAMLTTKETSGNLVLVDRDDKRPEANIAGLLTFNQPSEPKS